MKVFFKLLLLIGIIISVESLGDLARADEPSLFEQIARSDGSRSAAEISRTYVDQSRLRKVQETSRKLKSEAEAREKVTIHTPEKKNPYAESDTPPQRAGKRPEGEGESPKRISSDDHPRAPRESTSSSSKASGPHSTAVNPGEVPDEIIFSGE